MMYTNRKERGELLEAFVISNKDFTVPNFPQVIRIPLYLARFIYVLTFCQFLSQKNDSLVAFFFFWQMIHILWGENDRLLKLEIAQNLKG